MCYPGFKNLNWLVHNSLPRKGYKLAGFVELDISNHAFGFAHCDRNGPRKIEMRMWANVDLYSYPNGILEKCSLLAVFYSCVNRSILQGHCW